MAVTAIQVLEDGPRNYVLKVIGIGGDAATLLVTPSALDPPCTTLRILAVTYNLGPAQIATLLWDATTDTTACIMNGNNDAYMCFKQYGGIVNDSGAGTTGNVLLTTTGTDPYMLIIEFAKCHSPSFN